MHWVKFSRNQLLPAGTAEISFRCMRTSYGERDMSTSLQIDISRQKPFLVVGHFGRIRSSCNGVYDVLDLAFLWPYAIEVVRGMGVGA